MPPKRPYRGQKNEQGYTFKVNPEAQNTNVFLFDPRPHDLHAEVDADTVELSWKCDYTINSCKYVVHTDGRSFSCLPSLNQSVSVPFNNPGTYPWSIVTNIYAKTTTSNDPIIVATYRVNGEPFTITNPSPEELLASRTYNGKT